MAIEGMNTLGCNMKLVVGFMLKKNHVAPPLVEHIEENVCHKNCLCKRY